VLERRAEAVLGSGCVLQQQDHGILNFVQGSVARLSHPSLALLKTLTHVATEMRNQILYAEHPTPRKLNLQSPEGSIMDLPVRRG